MFIIGYEVRVGSASFREVARRVARSKVPVRAAARATAPGVGCARLMRFVAAPPLRAHLRTFVLVGRLV